MTMNDGQSPVVNIILAGLGVRGSYWGTVINENPRCRIVAYVDPNPAALARAIEAFGDHPTFATVEEAIDHTPEANALLLANPPIGREPQIRAAAAHGLALLVEKPLALSLQEAAHLVSIADAANIPLMVGLNFRYLAVTTATKALIAAGTVGLPAFGRFTYERWRDGNRPDLNKYPLTMDQPMLWEQSIHHFDLLRFVYGSDPVTVEARTWNPSWSMYKSDTNVSALFTFANGLIVNYQGLWQGGWAEPGFEWRTDCTNGVISQRDQFGALHYAQKFDKALTAIELPQHRLWITETKGLLDAFVGTVLDHQVLECSGQDHLLSLAMVEACVLSSQTGNSVQITDVLQHIQQND
jgi:predicted dehydrogenase